MKKVIFSLSPRSAVHGPRKSFFCFNYGRWTIVCGLFFLIGCATTQVSLKTQEARLMDSAEEALVGRSMAENIIKKGCPPVPDAARQLFINKIGQRIAQVCDRRDIVYHFMILDSPDRNAFALPGGYIYVYDGLIKKLSEPELAALLAHEVAHVTLKHPLKKMQAALGEDLLLGLAFVGLGQKDPVFDEEIAKVRPEVFALLGRGYDVDEEEAADRLALRYLRRTNYDPSLLAQVLKILNSGPGRVFETASSRARMDGRIRKVLKGN